MLQKLSINIPPNVILKFIKSYLISGELDRARDLFDRIPKPDLRSLTMLFTAYTKQGRPKESVNLYRRLRSENRIDPDKLVLLSIIKACAHSTNLIDAKEMHEEVVKLGFGSDLLLGNALVDMYGKCGFSEGAKGVFDVLQEKDVISWTSLIAAYANCRLSREGLHVLHEMILSGTRPNSVTLSTVLPMCSKLQLLDLGRAIHCFAIRNRLEDDIFVSSGLVDMYASCLSTCQARIVFNSIREKDVVSCIVILSAYFSAGECEEALELFSWMKFHRIPMNSASWNCMISGLVQNGKTEKAFEVFAEMFDSGFRPNKVTMACILPACINLENLRGGKEIHGYVIRHWFTEDTMVVTSIVFMYAKCGDLDKSRVVFDKMTRKDTVAWNTMIIANSMHGCGSEALSIFSQMIETGVRPNSQTFTGVLSACSHSQLVDEGRWVFNSMKIDHDFEPDAEHYACMVDVLSRAGYLYEAYELIQSMPMEPTASAWGALLAACRVHKNVELGKVAAEHLFEIEPENAGNYVLLSNMLVTAKLWDDASKIRVLMRDKLRERGITKVPGCSWIQIGRKVYTFVKGDKRNGQSDEIYGFLKEIAEKMRLEGYLPDTNFVLQDINREEKEEVLCSHSEKLAVALGILNLNGGSVIRVFKNLRICGDCHNAIKFIAKIIGVQVIVRDNVRFHHFRDGSCSCRDLW
ncbi:pentatricopeptide repeat-containing protein DOT4, chloroplastic-like [Ananas comosus]|uniref:Pentatricopeptide repeat-containing protein DOT4, chloroplastic-like n=1 Tax=Ananas comosus TaxID=4615 RepID=A0A6P5F6P7_ANACO|nr:pentatricopeptide repeat-containing protein DOT4, chloroplastic-like [Ananas comosus]